MSFEKIRGWVEAPKASCINHKKIQEVMQAYEIIKKTVLKNDLDAIVKISEGALQLGSVVIEITTINLTVYSMEEFMETIKNADNFEIYPRVDDQIQINILFEDVIRYICI